jgi:hypothetical protein
MPYTEGAPSNLPPGTTQYYAEWIRPTCEPDATGDFGARTLTNSTSYPDQNPWVTIPWTVPIQDPEGLWSLNAWSFLRADTRPVYYDIKAMILLRNVTPNAQHHIGVYEVDGAGIQVGSNDAWEWTIGPEEGHSGHIAGAWNGYLPAGRKLRMNIDMWHGTQPAKITGAKFRMNYWRLPAPPQASCLSFGPTWFRRK